MRARRTTIGEGVKISNESRINVTENLIIGPGSVINRGALIEGRSVAIGHEAWIDEYAHIGGGSCFERQSELVVGDFLHMGCYSHINTARRVTIGDEVGIGIGTKLFTHGSYLSAYEGFPVSFAELRIGRRVWLPNAWVNPGVTIGDDVVVAAMSLVNDDIPSGCLAAGIPARVIRKNAYPRAASAKTRAWIIDTVNEVLGTKYELVGGRIVVKSNGKTTTFDLEKSDISGPASNRTERLRNQLRRLGIRFRYSAKDGAYEPW